LLRVPFTSSGKKPDYGPTVLPRFGGGGKYRIM